MPAATRVPRVLTALVTPFAADGRADLQLAADLASRLVERGSDGFVIAGTTGESPTLSDPEKLALCTAVRQAVDGRAMVWLGTGSNDTAHSVELTRAAEGAGAEGVMAVVPYYSRPPQEGLLRHFAAIAEATTLPLMLYNIPGRTGTNLLPQTLARIAGQSPNLLAVKEASRDLEQAAEMLRLVPGLQLYSGDDQLTLPVLSIGGTGVVSVASHLVADRIAALIAAADEGRWSDAQQIHGGLLPLYRALFVTTNPIPVKVALRLAGFPAGGFRLPLCEPTAAEMAAIAQAVAAFALEGSLAP